MRRYLLAAEADKIQDFIFRSSRLREVVGASQLLSRFCREGACELLKLCGGDEGKDVIISDGGSFRVVFSDKGKCEEFGQKLAMLYKRAAGGSLSVAEPVAYDDGDFERANKTAHTGLRRAKFSARGFSGTAHLPYTAFCSSCGLSLAIDHRKRHKEERADYICASCLAKAGEQNVRGRGFLSDFIGMVQSELNPEHAGFDLEIPAQESMSQLGPRRYVSYMVADGNGMGPLFSSCKSEKAMRDLSSRLGKAMSASLARPCAALLKHRKDEFILSGNQEGEKAFLPVLPLILGGDDCFALLPAPYALDVVRMFCQSFQSEMKKAAVELGLDAAPTISAAVIVCKAKYPYTLAYERAKSLLERSKRVAKILNKVDNARVAAVDFELITGNQVTKDDSGGGRLYRSTLKPYFIADGSFETAEARDAHPAGKGGLLLDNLFKARETLSEIPRGRLQDLRLLYSDVETMNKDILKWEKSLAYIIKRTSRVNSEGESLKKGLSLLGGRGGEEQARWLQVEWPGMMTFFGHGMLDLIEMWDFACRIDGKTG